MRTTSGTEYMVKLVLLMFNDLVYLHEASQVFYKVMMLFFRFSSKVASEQ